MGVKKHHGEMRRLGGRSSFKEHYEVVRHIVLDNDTLADVKSIELNLDNAQWRIQGGFVGFERTPLY